MKRLIQDAVRWLSSGWNQNDASVTNVLPGEPENERRLRAMQENGKTLFLP
jgi:hypothetical protein